MTCTSEQKQKAEIAQEVCEKWAKKHPDLHYKMKEIVFEKWATHKKLTEKDLHKTKWGKQVLETLPVSLQEYLRCSIYFD